ncbi:MAG TPA: molybdopterin oxidoreductase family protein [Vicinamibacteria bacterium]|nr:molybdopterin oxidoreductase family protein [Vicinamibacteria bacterium]
MADAARTHFRTCHLCEAMCGIAIDLEGDRIVRVRGDKDDPFSRGHVCPKAVALQDVHEDADRLRRPLRRTASGWEEVPWETALDEAAARLAAVQRAHGRNAVALYQGNPVVHNHGAILFGQVFQRSLGSRSRYSATSVDQLPQMLASLLMFGHQLMLPIPDVDRTGFLLVLGANPLVSNGSILTAPGIERRLKALKARGGRLVVVDPRRTETAALADLHLPIRPGGDAFLLAALVHTLATENRLNPGRVGAFTDGLDSLLEAIRPFSPEAVAGRTGIDAATIRTLARDFASAASAVAYGRVGTCTQEFGGIASWLVNVLNLVTGNLDRPGGAMFTAPAVDVVAFADRIGQRGHFDKGRSRVRGLPEFGGEWPAAVLAEEIETPGEGQVRALVTSAGNPVLSTPNGARLDRALASLDYMVSIDLYLNETSRHAHLILPPSFALERSHYDLVFHALAVRNTAKLSEPLFPAPRESRHDWQILLELATRLEKARGEGGLRSWLRHRAFSALGPDGLVGLLMRFGPHGAGLVPFRRGLTLARLRREPHGIDLGPLEPSLPRRLYTKARRIELAPGRLLQDLGRLRLALAAPVNGGLALVGRRELRSNNSWMHNSERLVKGRERCTLLMHPQDASARGLKDGQRVRVTSRAGAVLVPLELSDEMRPGVVSLPHGWGHQRPGARLAVASARPGVSLNDLTDETLVDPLCGTARLNDVPVEVTAAAPEGR